MGWLPDGEKILKLHVLVLTEPTNVTDTQTDTNTAGRACTASRGKKCHGCHW